MPKTPHQHISTSSHHHITPSPKPLSLPTTNYFFPFLCKKPTAINKKTLKSLDQIHFWAPFNRESKGTPILLSSLLKSLRQTTAEAKQSSPLIHAVQNPPVTTPILIAFDTINQREALKGIISNLGSQATTLSYLPENQTESPPDIYFKSLALKYKYHLIYWFFTLKGRDADVFKKRFYKYYNILGVYHHLLQKLKKSPSLKLYIGSNDHSGLSQAGFIAAKKAGIPSLYIQHASVSDKFPPLTMDYALLEGEDAKQKYLAAGTNPTTRIHLVGTLKYDPYLNSEKLDIPGRLIAVCVGALACDYDQNFNLCSQLEKENKPFCIRFHPAVQPDIRKRFTDRNWNISYPDKELALDFILRCHTIISGDSNILLEAIILKRRPVYFASDGIGLDYYGFLKNGIVDTVHYRYEHVIESLSQPFDLETHRGRAKHYHDPLYTEYEGRSTELAMKYINEIVFGG